MQRRYGWLWIALIAPACVAFQWLGHAYIVANEGTTVRLGLVFLHGIPHALVNVLLLWVFGRTLKKGEEPLITGFARRIHGTLPAYLASYTRRITLAWCAVFALQLLTSAVLFSWASLETWSLFVNVLSFPVVVAMFVGEYAYRVMRYRNYPHVSIWAGIRMFVTSRSQTMPESARAIPSLPVDG